MKYQNKDGIALNYTGNDTHQVLVREVVSEAITMLEDIGEPLSGIDDTINFLKENFDIKDENE